MTRQEKAQVIDGLVEKFNETQFFYLADSSGLSVVQTDNFREKCYKAGVEYKVVKNTLIKKALEKVEGDFSALDSELKGFTGILFSPESNNAPAKVIKEFRKDGGERPVLKAAYIDSDVYIGDDKLKELSSLKSKSELIGEIIGLLQSPAKNVISALQSSGQTLSGLVKTLSEREEN